MLMSNKVKTTKMNQSKYKLVPRLRFPEFNDAGEWEVKPLNKACQVNPSVQNLPNKFIYVDLESVKDGTLLQKKNIQLDGAPSRAQRLLKKGDVLFQMVRPYQQNNYFFNTEESIPYVASTGYAQLRACESNDYLFQYLHNDKFLERVLDKCTGSNYPAIKSSDLSKIEIAIPSPLEQQKIADCLSSIDDLITAESKKLESIKNHKKGLMQNLFPSDGKTTPNFRFPEFQNAGDWEETILGNHCKITTGKLDANAMVENGQYRFYTCAKEYYLIDKYAFDTDALLVSGNGANVGYIHYYKGKFNAYQRTYVLDQFSQDIFFIKYYLERNLHKRIATEKKEGNTPYIVISTLTDMIVALPKNKKEQQKIADCLSYADELITSQTQKIEVLKTHKKGLMQQLFPNIDQNHKSK